VKLMAFNAAQPIQFASGQFQSARVLAALPGVSTALSGEFAFAAAS
jgi:hypothetical protein